MAASGGYDEERRDYGGNGEDRGHGKERWNDKGAWCGQVDVWCSCSYQIMQRKILRWCRLNYADNNFLIDGALRFMRDLLHCMQYILWLLLKYVPRYLRIFKQTAIMKVYSVDVIHALNMFGSWGRQNYTRKLKLFIPHIRIVFDQ